jgi:hypothetical protein
MDAYNAWAMQIRGKRTGQTWQSSRAIGLENDCSLFHMQSIRLEAKPHTDRMTNTNTNAKHEARTIRATCRRLSSIELLFSGVRFYALDKCVPTILY